MDAPPKDEIERKFLVESPLPRSIVDIAQQPWTIHQGYVVAAWESGGVEARLRFERPSDDRQSPARCTLTFKVDRDKGQRRPLIRPEAEASVSWEHFVPMWRLTQRRRLTKVRTAYFLDTPNDGPRIMTVDVYVGHMQGLALAELEFQSADAAESFTPPPFLGEEVTHDSRYRNAHLAILGLPSPS